MPQTENSPPTHLNLAEAICLLAYGIASENGGNEWRETALTAAEVMSKDSRKDDEKDRRARDKIQNEETERFFWSIGMLQKMAEAEMIQVLGQRQHHAERHPIPSMDFIHGRLDPVGKTGGCLNPAEFTVDYDRRIWVGLQFKRAEIEKARDAHHYVDPAATPPATAMQKYENWADRALVLHDNEDKSWGEAANIIATSDKADSTYVERQVRMVRKTRRESGNPI